MSVACVDTSVLTAIAFDKPGADALAARLDEFTRLVSSNLLEAELRTGGSRIEGACGTLTKTGRPRTPISARPDGPHDQKNDPPADGRDEPDHEAELRLEHLYVRPEFRNVLLGGEGVLTGGQLGNALSGR